MKARKPLTFVFLVIIITLINYAMFAFVFLENKSRRLERRCKIFIGMLICVFKHCIVYNIKSKQ